MIKNVLFKISFWVMLLIVGTSLYAQVPQGIPYQAAARGANGQPLVNTTLKVRFSVIDSVATGTTVYQETHIATTNIVGLFSLNVGLGTPVTGTFAGINWGKNFKFMRVELDETGTGSNYTDLGTQQMMSVPYALYAGNVVQGGNGSSSGNSNTSGTNHGEVVFYADTFFVVNNSTKLIQVEFKGASGGGGASAYNPGWWSCSGSTGGQGVYVNYYESVNSNDTIFIRVGKNGQGGVQSPASFCGGIVGSSGTNGTVSEISLNDRTFNTYLFRCEPGFGGGGTYVTSYPYCSCGPGGGNPLPGSNGSLSTGTQYLNSGSFIISQGSFSGTPSCKIRW